ncbi:MAG: hypothetical protein GF320_14640 [Armatimonadia bacterium]|nr:hypothetical protein [Armatimonadia bacterium]
MPVILTLFLLACSVSATDVTTDHDAAGDGTTDDTAAFQAALDACHGAGGGAVHVPAGRYLIAGHLTVPDGVVLEGVWRAPHGVSLHESVNPDELRLDGSVLLVTEDAGDASGTPFITLGNNAGLKGLTIFYPEQTQTDPPVAYPWTVRALGWDTSIRDVLMINPYQAVDLGSAYVGRHTVRGLYAQALYRGLFIDDCHDILRIQDVHLFPFWDFLMSPLKDFMEREADAFVIGRTDWQQMTDCFCIGYRTGFRFIDSPMTEPYDPGPGNVLIQGGGADGCRRAVWVEQTQGHAGVSFTGCQIFGDIIVEPTNEGPVKFTGCGIFGSIHGEEGVRFGRIAGSGPVLFTGCHFHALHPDAQDASAGIVATEGRLTITGSVFETPLPRAIVLQESVRAAVVMGNQFSGPEPIVDRTDGAAQIGLNARLADVDAP